MAISSWANWASDMASLFELESSAETGLTGLLPHDANPAYFLQVMMTCVLSPPSTTGREKKKGETTR